MASKDLDLTKNLRHYFTTRGLFPTTNSSTKFPSCLGDENPLFPVPHENRQAPIVLTKHKSQSVFRISTRLSILSPLPKPTSPVNLYIHATSLLRTKPARKPASSISFITKKLLPGPRNLSIRPISFIIKGHSKHHKCFDYPT